MTDPLHSPEHKEAFDEIGLRKMLAVLEAFGRGVLFVERRAALEQRKKVVVEESGIILGGKFTIRWEFDGSKDV